MSALHRIESRARQEAEDAALRAADRATKARLAANEAAHAAMVNGTPTELRAWQGAALPTLLTALGAKRKGVVVACTGSGKTVLLAEVCAHRLPTSTSEVIVITTPTQRLVRQVAQTVAKRIGAAKVGRYFTEAKEPSRPVVVCCNDSFAALSVQLEKLGRKCVLWIADEAHKTETEAIHEVVEGLAPETRLGFTATAHRSKETERLRLFDEELVRYTPANALKDGVICRWRIVPWTGEAVELDDAMIAMIKETTGPGACNATSIRDAEAFAEKLCAAGVPALAVHSRLTPGEQASRLRDLEEEKVRAVVYPSLLSEGADFPFLRWIGFRRKTGSRNRFIQEAGRVLRTCVGKEEAIILDPLGLTNEFSMTYAAAIGWEEDVEEELPPAEPRPVDPDLVVDGWAFDFDLEEPPTMVNAFDAVGTWARQLWLAALADGLVKEGRPQRSDARAKVPSSKQVETLGKMRWASTRLPQEHQAAIARMVEHNAVPTTGVAADLLDVLFAVKQIPHRWLPTLPIWPPPDETWQAAAAAMAGDWSCAAKVTQSYVSVVVMQGRRIRLSETRVRKRERQLDAEVEAFVRALSLAGDSPVFVSSPEAAKAIRGGTTPSGAVARWHEAQLRECETLEATNVAERAAWAATGKAKRDHAKVVEDIVRRATA